MKELDNCRGAIVLDFDHTIFNTTLYVEALRDAISHEGVAPEIFDQQREALKSCCSIVDIDLFVQALPLEDKDCLHRAIHKLIKERASDFVFGDVQRFIDRYRGEYMIAVLTQGDEELQSEKVRHSGVRGIDQVIITKGDKSLALEKVVTDYDNIYFIDDKAKHIEEVKERFPSVEVYFIQRPDDKPYAGTEVTCRCAHVIVESLDDVVIQLSDESSSDESV